MAQTSRTAIRAIKYIAGGLCILLCIGPISLSIENKQPLFLLEIPLFAGAAFLLLRKTKREKMMAARKSDIKTTVHSATVGPITIESEYIPTPVPPDIAKDMRKSYSVIQAKREFEIMSESYTLASSTLSMDVFCVRLALAQKYAHTLLQAEQAGVRCIKKLNIHNACIAVIGTTEDLKIRMLADYEQSSFLHAEALKTPRGRLNRYIKIKRELLNAEPTFMFMEEYDNLVEKVNDRIAALGGNRDEKIPVDAERIQ